MVRLYIDEKVEGLDVNDTNAVSSWFKVEGCEEIIIYVESMTGTSATFDVCLEISPDGTFNGGCYKDPDGTEAKVQGEGHFQCHDTVPVEYVRVHCVVAEGSAATADIYIQGFRKV